MPCLAQASAQSLVLLDEPVTSTDPQEGAALAEALLCHLASLNMKVVVTTHYGPLKELAQMMPGFANASVEFDVTRLAPTYRLFLGVPGGSSALEIAGRLGMDEKILDDARQRLPKDDRRLEDLMADLQQKQRQLADDLVRAAASRTPSPIPVPSGELLLCAGAQAAGHLACAAHAAAGGALVVQDVLERAAGSLGDLRSSLVGQVAGAVVDLGRGEAQPPSSGPPLYQQAEEPLRRRWLF